MDLKIFEKDEFKIRVLGDSISPLFVAKDICDALGYSKTDTALRKLDDDEKATEKVSTLGGVQSMVLITESGLYKLIMRSNKSEAKQFQNWVTKEVLPTIRKSGSYCLTEHNAISAHAASDTAIIKMLETIAEQNNQTQQLLSYVIRRDEKSDTQKLLEEERARLEIEKLQLEKIAMVADLSTKYKLEQLGPLDDVPSELRQSMAITAGTIVKDVRQAINGISVTECLKLANIDIKAKDFNLFLGKIGVLLRVEYQHPFEGTKLSWEITEDGRYFGYNQHMSSKRKYPVTPKFYSDRFGELLDLLRNEGYID